MNKSLIFVGVLLVVALGFQMFGLASQRKNLVAPNIGELLPKEIPGWLVEDRPVADSPEMLKAVERILSYDSAVFRIYKQGGTEISVYAAYWLPAKVPVNAVDAHTPDICWVANGWEMRKRSPLPDQQTALGTVPVPNVREFMVSGHELSVAYWHVNGNELRQNESVLESKLSFAERVKRRLSQFKNIIFTPPGQQLFVRVSSNKEIDAGMTSPPVAACLELVAKTMNGKIFYQESGSKS